MSKFKVGDTVVCKVLGNNVYITVGKEYEVLEVEENSVIILNDGTDTYNPWECVYFDYLFELKKEVLVDTKTGTSKRRFSLLPVEALQASIDVFESGNIEFPWRKAYPVDSWRRHNGKIVESMLKYIDSTVRHLMDIKWALETGDHSRLFTEDTGVFTAGAVTFGGLALTQFSIELTGKKPSADGKREIENMKEGKDPYGIT